MTSKTPSSTNCVASFLVLYTVNDLLPTKQYYDGETYLCPPTQKRPGLQTTLGLIQIHLRGESRSLAIKKPSDIADYFGRDLRDSMCRQMGFSRAVPGGVYTIAALNEIQYDFSDCNE